jgi:hypothetical protein
LNEKVTVSSKGKLRDTSFVAWNDRWVKDAPTNTASQTKPTKKYKSGSREWQNFCRDASIKYAKLYQSYMNNKTDYDSFFKKKELSPLSDDAIKNIERVVGRDFYKWREIDVVQYDLKTEYLQTKDDFNDIGDFTFMPAIALTDTLDAIVALAKNNTQANAEKLAKLLGVKLKKVETRFNDLPKEQQIDFVADFMARTGVYNLYLGTKKDDDLSDADIAILGDINANDSNDSLRELERDAVKKILEKGVSLTANSRNTIPESDLRGLNIAPVAKIVKIKKTAKTPDDLFNLVATTAATNDVRLALTGIKVEANGDLITTDGHTMTVIRDSGIKREAGIYPTSKTVNDFKRKLLKQGKTQEDIDEAIAEHEAALKNEKFPDYHRVLPQKKWFMPADFITVDLAKFKGIVDSIYRACTKAVSHKFGGIQLESEDTVATVNYVYLLNAIKTLTSMGYQEAVFWFNHEDTYINRSMMLQSHDEKVSSIIMPMRSNHKDTLAFKPINLNNLDDWNWQKDDFNSVDDETETEYYWLCQEELDLIAA